MSNEEYAEIMDKSNFMIDSANPYDMEIKKALKKQIPIELEKQGFFKACKCGCVMSTCLMYNRSNYCPNCGQAIKCE